ncbi:hypothetical protein [Frigoribacterium sp. Leaf8]|uniref:hypothetical protein n=1 Tax=Frigoribacterium sp. Leaf8 TaxID=1735673 RepID=UPI0012F8D015|nr:hypothetical protein [Frigoribacterium sp. Leaf8]
MDQRLLAYIGATSYGGSVNPTPSPSSVLVEFVSENDWWNAPVFAVLAGVLGVVLGGLISLWASSRSETAQTRREARKEVFAGFDQIATDFASIRHRVLPINDGDTRHGDVIVGLIEGLQANTDAAARRIRVYDGALSKSIDTYTASLQSVLDAFADTKGKYQSAVLAWLAAYEELERAVGKRVGV